MILIILRSSGFSTSPSIPLFEQIIGIICKCCSQFPDIKPSIGEANWGFMGEIWLQHDYRLVLRCTRCVCVCLHTRKLVCKHTHTHLVHLSEGLVAYPPKPSAWGSKPLGPEPSRQIEDSPCGPLSKGKALWRRSTWGILNLRHKSPQMGLRWLCACAGPSEPHLGLFVPYSSMPRAQTAGF